jgi:hypothetical protein
VLMYKSGGGVITTIGFEGQVKDLAAEGKEVVDLLPLCYDDQHGSAIRMKDTLVAEIGCSNSRHNGLLLFLEGEFFVLMFGGGGWILYRVLLKGGPGLVYEVVGEWRREQSYVIFQALCSFGRM